MKKCLSHLVLLGVLLFSFNSFAVSPPVVLVGPKITDRVERTIRAPGYPAIYDINGDGFLDVALPAYGNLLGLNNRNNWVVQEPNQYFQGDDLILKGDQLWIVSGNFDADPRKDLVILGETAFSVCYNYENFQCDGEIDLYHIKNNDPLVEPEQNQPITNFTPDLSPWAAKVADFNGDGRDDVAIIGHRGANYLYGGLVVYMGPAPAAGGNGRQPLTHTGIIDIYEGIPLALDVSDFDGDGDRDIAVSFMPTTGLQGFLKMFKNTNGNFSSALVGIQTGGQNTDSNLRSCYAPTGLVTYQGSTGLVVTCYLRDKESFESGPVYILKKLPNDGDQGFIFSTEQTLENLNFPYSSAVADLNRDNLSDLAVASIGGNGVFVYRGTEAFHVEAEGSRTLFSTANYAAKYVQTADLNNDGRLDLLVSANKATLPELRNASVSQNMSSAILDRSVASAEVFGKRVYRVSDASGIDSISTADHQALIGSYSVSGSVQGAITTSYTMRDTNNFESVALLLDASSEYTPLETIQRGVIISTLAPTTGVIAFVSVESDIVMGQPDCNNREVSFSCTPPVGRTLTACTLTSVPADGVVVTPAVLQANGSWVGSVRFPSDARAVYTVNIEARDRDANDGGEDNITTTSSIASFTSCMETVENVPCAESWNEHIRPNVPFNICLDKAIVAANQGEAIEAVQTAGPSIFAIDENSPITGHAAMVGSCLQGVLIQRIQSREERFSFTINDCPLQITLDAASLEGSGGLFGCSLGPVTNFSLRSILLVVGIFLVPLGRLFWIKKK